MKKLIFIALASAVPAISMAQAAVDVANLSQFDMRGTARFMSMGGAFTALGGDLSTLTQNPAGIGIYRSSEVGITLDLDFQSFKTTTPGYIGDKSQTKFACNNFGYIGTVNLYSESTPTISFGATYNRVGSFDRVTKGAFRNLGGASLSNYIAAMTNSEGNIYPVDMEYNGPYADYNPYIDGNAPWLSILSYTGFIINNNLEDVVMPDGSTSTQETDTYFGLMGEGTTGSASFETREKGYIDEYNISIGGNIYNTVYWGLSVGITDLEYKQMSYYQENLKNAYIAAQNPESGAGDIVNGDADYRLDNYLHSSGEGFNLKFGLIVKPIPEFRIGLAVHTPTWYKMTDSYWGGVDYVYTPNDPRYSVNRPDPEDPNLYLTNDGESWHDYNMRTPWRMMVGMAGVIGGQAIISADYEYRGTNMQLSDVNNNEYDVVSEDIKTYYKGTNILRLGAEYRVTPQFSVRAGYCYESSPVKTEAANDGVMIWTAGTIPSYTFNKTTQYVTAGLGYRFGGFYADLAYVHRHRESTWHAFSPVIVDYAIDQDSPSAKVSSNNNQVVLSLGYKF